MNKVRVSVLNLLIVGLVMICCSTGLAGATGQDRANTSEEKASIGHIPLFFIANKGQFDPQVKYYLQTSSRVFFFTSQGVTLLIKESTADPAKHQLQPASFVIRSCIGCAPYLVNNSCQLLVKAD